MNAWLRLADNWDVNANKMTKNSFGVWEVTVPSQDGAAAIPHESKIKASLQPAVMARLLTR